MLAGNQIQVNEILKAEKAGKILNTPGQQTNMF